MTQNRVERKKVQILSPQKLVTSLCHANSQLPNMTTRLPTLTTNSRSDLGPLTTIFTPPADCTGFQIIGYSEAGLNVAASFYCYTSSPLNGPDPLRTSIIESCYPEGYASYYNTYWNEYDKWSKIGVYSPASICPSGYTVACQQARSTGQQNPFNDNAAETIWDMLRDGESAAGCCPM